ncbi:MAG: IS21-like element helper ATPase IstB [Cyanobacteria bacterium]|nr:IS21-like element helper ATPase IstB [Cyanobacteriota bacterium]
MLHSFHLPSFGKHYLTYARQAEKERLDHVEYLYHLAKLETEERHHRRTERLLKQAKLPKGKRIADFEISRFANLSQNRIDELSNGSLLDQAGNLLIFGNPGTGKSHLCIGLAREWCLQGRQILYSTAAALVQDLLVAKRDLKLNPLLTRLSKFEAIVIDDISYIPHEKDETDVLFLLIAERYEQKSLVVTSNLPFSDWGSIFKDTVTTSAAIDRLVHHASILELNGPSYRTAQAAERKQKQASS